MFQVSFGMNNNPGHVTDTDHLSVNMPHTTALSTSAPDVRCVQSIECSIGRVDKTATATATDQPLIQLNSTCELEGPIKQTAGYGTLNMISSKSVTLPRNASLPGSQTLWSMNDGLQENHFGNFVSCGGSSSCNPIPECTTASPSSGEEQTNVRPATRSGPVPRPRSSLKRSTAFHGRTAHVVIRKSSSATSLRATDGQTLKDARSAFLQSDATKHSLNHLEQFDPLLTGQLAIDLTSHDAMGSCSGTPGNGGAKQEENLLREWNLDFSKMSPLNGRDKAPPVVAPKPPPRTHHLVNTPASVPAMQPRATCGTLPAQFKGQLPYMPPKQKQPPPPGIDCGAPPAPWKGYLQPRHGVQSLINTFEKSSTPRNMPGQHQQLGAAPIHVPKSNARVDVNQVGDLSRDLLQDPFGDMLNMTAKTSPPQARSPRATWTTFD